MECEHGVDHVHIPGASFAAQTAISAVTFLPAMYYLFIGTDTDIRFCFLIRL